MDDKTVEKAPAPDSLPDELEIAVGRGGQRRTLVYRRVTWPSGEGEAGLRYGENPGQPAALYRPVNGFVAAADVAPVAPDGRSASRAELTQPGRLPSKTGIRSLDVALSVLRCSTDKATCVLVKHANPCGAARTSSVEGAFVRAALANRMGANGACAAFNRPIGPDAAEAILTTQLDIVAAPGFEPAALDKLGRQPNLTLLRIGDIARLAAAAVQPHLELTTLLDGGLIAQWGLVPPALTREDCAPARAVLHRAQEIRCKRPPTADELDDLLFAWHIAEATASDSIVLVKDGVTVSIGIGGQDRTATAEAARDKAYRKLADRLAWERFKTPFNALTDEPMRESIWTDAVELRGGLIGAAMASDGAIGAVDALEGVFKEGVTAVIQPGGSPHDGDVIRLCNEYNAAMVFTGRRAFRH